MSEGHSTLSNSSLLRGDRRADNRDMRGWSSTNLSERRTESESPTVRPDPPVAAWGNPLPFPEPKSSNKSSKPGGGGFHGDNGGVSLTGEFQYPPILSPVWSDWVTEPTDRCQGFVSTELTVGCSFPTPRAGQGLH